MPIRAVPALGVPAGRYAGGLASSPGVRWCRASFNRSHWLIAAVLYLVAALIMQSHAVLHIGTHISGNLIADPTQYMWAMWWWPHAVFSGINPFVTHAIYVPDAYNLGSVTSTPFPSMLFLPLNLILGWQSGPVVSYNLCMLIAPVISAWFAYRLCLYVSQAPAASIVGGWLYGFSAYGLSQLQGHMNLVFTFLPVVLVLLSLQRIDGVIGRWRYVGCAALALAIQIGIGTEVVGTTTVLLVIALAVVVIVAPADRRSQIVRIVPELVLAYVLAALVCSPYLYYQAIGPEVEPDTNSVSSIADLLSYFVPTQLFQIAGEHLQGISGTFPPVAGLAETGTYLGVPLIVGSFSFFAANWRRWAVWPLIVVALVAFVWSFGPALNVSGIATIALPWRWIDTSKPFFNEVSPSRIGSYVELVAAVAFALWLAPVTRLSPIKWIVAVAAVAALWPNINGISPGGGTIYDEDVTSPAFITQGIYRHYLRHNEVVLPLPFGPYGNTMLWQAQTDGYFRLASGWFGYYPPGYQDNLIFNELLSFKPFTDPVAQMRRFFVDKQVGAVVMEPAWANQWPTVMSQLGLRRQVAGGLFIYEVPARLRRST